ncbi:MAG: hypothetical protein AVDCRST_MAG57-236, partial [uncultured Blastococcus sp.]
GDDHRTGRHDARLRPGGSGAGSGVRARGLQPAGHVRADRSAARRGLHLCHLRPPCAGRQLEHRAVRGRARGRGPAGDDRRRRWPRGGLRLLLGRDPRAACGGRRAADRPALPLRAPVPVRGPATAGRRGPARSAAAAGGRGPGGGRRHHLPARGHRPPAGHGCRHPAVAVLPATGGHGAVGRPRRDPHGGAAGADRGHGGRAGADRGDARGEDVAGARRRDGTARGSAAGRAAARAHRRRRPRPGAAVDRCRHPRGERL